jgi:hypothetical protein
MVRQAARISRREAAALPWETYTPERKAEFLLSNVTDARDYARAVNAVKALGLDPAKVPHYKLRGAAKPRRRRA